MFFLTVVASATYHASDPELMPSIKGSMAAGYFVYVAIGMVYAKNLSL